MSWILALFTEGAFLEDGYLEQGLFAKGDGWQSMFCLLQGINKMRLGSNSELPCRNASLSCSREVAGFPLYESPGTSQYENSQLLVEWMRAVCELPVAWLLDVVAGIRRCPLQQQQPAAGGRRVLVSCFWVCWLLGAAPAMSSYPARPHSAERLPSRAFGLWSARGSRQPRKRDLERYAWSGQRTVEELKVLCSCCACW